MSLMKKILQRVFSIKKERYHRVIYILGIRKLYTL